MCDHDFQSIESSVNHLKSCFLLILGRSKYKTIVPLAKS